MSLSYLEGNLIPATCQVGEEQCQYQEKCQLLLHILNCKQLCQPLHYQNREEALGRSAHSFKQEKLNNQKFRDQVHKTSSKHIRDFQYLVNCQYCQYVTFFLDVISVLYRLRSESNTHYRHNMMQLIFVKMKYSPCFHKIYIIYVFS